MAYVSALRRLAWLVGLAVLLGVASSAAGATVAVNTTTDELTPGDGLCSLREAIEAVDSAATSGDCGSVGSAASTIVLGAGDFKLVFPPTGGDANNVGDLNVSSNVTGLTIAGRGAALTTIDATGLGDRVLEVGNGASVTLTGLTLTGGHASDGAPGSRGADVSGEATAGPGKAGNGGEDGGGAFNDGSLTLIEASVIANTAGKGGAGGEGGTSEGGKGGAGGAGGAGGKGGGIFNNAGTLTLIHSTAAGNSAGTGGKGGAGGRGGVGLKGGTGGNGGAGGVGPEDGGGIANEYGAVTIEGSTLSGNAAGDGGIGGEGGHGNNTGGAGGNGGSASWGGGISSLGGSLAVQNSTITADAAGAGGPGGHGGDGGFVEFPPPSFEEFCNPGTGGAGGNGGNGGDGGGLRVTNGASSLTHVTVASDSVGYGGQGGEGGFSESCGGVLPGGSGGSYGSLGGGGELFVQGTAMTLSGTIVVGSSIGQDCSGPFSAVQVNMSFGDATCPGTKADPKLGPLQDNGGPTQTMALGAGSPALDLVPAVGAGCPATDQRGVVRPQGGGCDLGAYELAGPAALTEGTDAIGASGATVTGAVTASAADASVLFEFGTSAAYGSRTPVQHVGGVAPVAVSAALSGLSPNTTYHYRVLASTVYGSAAGADRTFTTNAAGTPGAPGPSGAPGGAPAPSITSLTIAPATFSVATRHKGRKRPIGATISYVDSEAATTTFVVRRARQGIVRGKRCTRATGRPARRSRRCSFYEVVASFAHVDVAGRNVIHFSGRLRGHPLPRGAYRLTATPLAQGKLGASATVGFRIV